MERDSNEASSVHDDVVILIKEIGSSLFSVLSTLSLTDEVASRPHVRLEELLLELEAIWSRDISQYAPIITNELLNLKSGLELFSDYVYRVTKMIQLQQYSYHRQLLVLICTALIHWARHSKKMRLKLLTNGLLYSQIGAIEILNNRLPCEDAMMFLSLHFKLLFTCFLSSQFSYFYTFSGKKWYKMLAPTIISDCAQLPTRLSAFLLGSIVAPSFTSEQFGSLQLNEKDFEYVLDNCLLSAESEASHQCHKTGEVPSLTLEETFLALQKLAVHSKNRALFMSSNDFISALLALLTSGINSVEVKAVCKLLLVLDTTGQDIGLFIELLQQYQNNDDLCVSMYSSAVVYLFQGKGFDVVADHIVQSLLKIATLLLENYDFSNPGGETFELYSFYLMDIFDTILVIMKAEPHYINVLVDQVVKHKLLPSLYELATKLFSVLHSVSDEAIACLTTIFQCILCWSRNSLIVSHLLLHEDFLREHVQQLTTLSAPEYTWFIRFLVHLNLAIVFSCAENVDDVSSLSHIDWQQLLLPWLKSKNESTKVLAYFIFACACTAEDAQALSINLDHSSVQHIHESFVTAVESASLSCAMFDCMCTVSVVTILRVLKRIVQIQKKVVEPNSTINLVATLLLSGSKNETIATCEYLSTLQKNPCFSQLYKQSEISITEILEGIQGCDDPALKHSADQTLASIEGQTLEVEAPPGMREYSSLLSNLIKALVTAASEYSTNEKELCDLLTKIQKVYQQSSTDTRLKLVEYTIISSSLVEEMCQYVCWFIKSKKITSTPLYQCLSIILSILSSWTDVSSGMRYKVMETEVLVYIADLICTLSSITNDEMEPVKQMLSVAAIVLSNCSQEKEFGWFYTSPGLVDWSLVLENWMSSPYIPLYFSAKLITGYMSHVLDEDKLQELLCLTDEEIRTFSQMLYESVISKKLTAIGFGCQFATEELIVLLNNFLHCKSNFKMFVKSETLLPSLLLLLNTDMKNKTILLRLILGLSGSVHFRKTLKDSSVLEIVSEISTTADDPCFSFLCSCLFSILLGVEYPDYEDDSPTVFYSCDASGFPQIRTSYVELMTKLVQLVSVELDKVSDGKLTLSSKNQAHHRILQIIREMYAFWMKASNIIQIEVAEEIAKHPNILAVMHDFILKAYEALTIQKDNLIGPCFIELLLCVLGWMQRNELICQHAVKTGYLLKYVKFHQKPSLVKKTNISQFILQCQRTLIMMCVQCAEVSAYFSVVDWFNVLSPLSSSENCYLKLLSKMIAGHIVSSLAEEELSLIKFTCDDAQNFIDLIHEAGHADTFKERGNFKLNLSTLLLSANCLLTLVHNVPLVTEYLLELMQGLVASHDNIISLLLHVVQATAEDVNAHILRLEACKLLFYIVENQTDLLTQEHTDHIFEIVKCCINSTKELTAVCECIVLLLENDKREKSDIKQCLVYANAYYIMKWWNKCIEICNKIEKEVSELSLLKGKALYYKFIDEQRKLNLKKLSIDVKKNLSAKVYAMNKTIIFLFGKAFDHGYLDNEASTMFDRVMMDCIFEANMFDSCSRCYCCRKNLKTTGQKLIKSHIISKAILEEFADSLGVGNKQVLFAKSSSIGTAQKRTISPGELSYHMLCHECEEIVSAFGETQFVPNFLRRVYSKECTSTAGACQIEYGPWLYQFCISLLFRALHWNMDNFVNSEAIYKVLKACQAQIISWGEKSICLSSAKPNVYIFISPLSTDLEEKQYGYMNWFLTGSIGGYFGNAISANRSLVEASFFVVRFGCINVFVNFHESFLSCEYSKFCINPEGGTFCVPKNEERKHLLPSPLWSLFRKLSSQLTQMVWEVSETTKSFEKTSFGYNPDDDCFGIQRAILADSEPIMRHLVIESSSLNNFLPSEFSVRPSSAPRKINLPKGHHLLLHANYVRGPKDGSTFFIATGTSGKYPIDKPYVIWHFYDSGSRINCGAFFDIETLAITNFLIGNNSSLFAHKKGASFMRMSKERMPKILKDLLRDKGFSSMKSLLYRVKSSLRRRGILPPYDTKCAQNQDCWFCRTLCQNCCIKPYAYGRLSNTPEGVAQLCSESCQKLTPEKFEALQVFVITDANTNSVPIHCDPISSRHEVLSHIYIQRKNKQGFPCEVEMALCVGDGTEDCPANRPYVVFYSHHLFHQTFVEFFVNLDFLAEEPLPAVANEMSWNIVLKLNNTGIVRKCFEESAVLDDVLVKMSEIVTSI